MLKTRQPHKIFFNGARWLVFGLPFGLAWLVYSLTAAAGLSWQHGGEDGGDLATAVALLGIPHPTGYPLYLLTGRGFLLLLPGLDPARALNLFSALCGAIAVGLTALAVFELNLSLRDKSSEARFAALSGGIVAGLGLAFAPLVWSQALITEVYSFGLMLNALLLLALVRWWTAIAGGNNKQAFRWLALTALVGGLAVGQHRTGLFTVVAVIIFYLVTKRQSKPSSKLPKMGQNRLFLALIIALFMAGLIVPYLYLVWRGGAQPASNWLDIGPANLADFWQYFSGSDYQNLLFAAPLSQSLGRVAASINLLLKQFGPVGFGLGWLGLVISWQQFRPLFWFTLSGILLHLGFALVYAADNSQVYLLPVFWLWAILSGYGFSWLGLKLVEWYPFKPKAGWLVRVWFYPALVILLGPGLGVLINYSRLDLSHDRGAEEWASAALQQAPANAIVVSDEDAATFALWYAREVQHYRPDVALVERRLLDKPWYRRNLAKLYPELKLEDPSASDTLSNWLNLLDSLNPGRAVLKVSVPSGAIRGLPA